MTIPEAELAPTWRDIAVVSRPSAETNPTMTIMQDFPSGESFGLDRPLNLLGSPAADCAQRIGMEWVPGLVEFLANDTRHRRHVERSWFHVAPLALVGDTDDEARFVARRMARVAGVPLFVMDAGRLQPDALRRSGARGPELVVPPDPVIAMASARCANPIVLVLGLGGAAARIGDDIATMLDPDAARRWLCRSINAVIDLGEISWMIAASNEHALPTSLYTRLEPLSIGVPRDPTERMLRVLVMALEVMADHDLEIEEVGPALATIFDDPDGEWSRMSCLAAGALYEAVARHLLRAANALRF